VQGYVYAAWRAATQMCTAIGRTDDAARFAAKAAVLRDRFDDAFWCDELGTFALALDGRNRPCRVRSSNAGQCLFTGIARPERARILADQLLGPDMFSGWGIRTLSALEQRYNPLSYHNGSVWPHDNALIALGLSRYGLKQHALRVLEGLFDAAQLMDLNRTPELFCGLPRRLGEGPTLYPVACAPQAWAAATAFGLVRSVLGLSVRADPPRVRFHRPVLPRFLDEVVLANLPVGADRVTVRLHRYPDDVGVNVTERSGPIEIVVVK
jgi:glycogen debranching enzyme